jgi:hypothetical protein
MSSTFPIAAVERETAREGSAGITERESVTNGAVRVRRR